MADLREEGEQVVRYWWRFREQDGGWSPWEEVSLEFYMSHQASWDTDLTTTGERNDQH